MTRKKKLLSNERREAIIDELLDVRDELLHNSDSKTCLYAGLYINHAIEELRNGFCSGKFL